MEAREWEATSPVPTARSGVADAELDGERVLYDPSTWAVAHLDHIGAVLWPLFDGTGTLEELAADVADAFGITLADALAGVVALATELDGLGLLEGNPTFPDRPAPPTSEQLVDPPSP